MKRSMGWMLTLTTAAALALAAGCGAENDAVLGEEYDANAALVADDAKADGVGGAPTYTYYRARHDYRRCAYPACGGFWVRRVNVSTTRCLDGTYASECYVTAIDYAPLAVSERALEPLKANIDKALLRGYLAPKSINGRTWPVFRTTEGWNASSGTTEPTGIYRRLQDNGLRCITFPCFSIHAARLNQPYHTNVSGTDLRPSGAPEAEQEKAQDAIMSTRGGILAVGTLRSTPNAGPAGTGVNFVATQFYFKVVP
jgi:hypothetical protein